VRVVFGTNIFAFVIPTGRAEEAVVRAAKGDGEGVFCSSI
jgi:hypothetical protein